MITQQLTEQAPGIYVSETSAKLIKENQQTLLLHSLEYKGNLTTYLFSDDTCHGVVKLGEPVKIPLAKFYELYPQHRCTESQRRLWFSGKKVLFGYPIQVLEKRNSSAKITHTLGDLFVQKYNLGTDKKEQARVPISDFSGIKDISLEEPLLVYNQEENSFVINLEKENPLSENLQVQLLKSYGPETVIQFGNDFGNSYIPLLRFSGKRYKELQEVKNLESVPSVIESPKMITMEFRDPRRYVVEKKFNGVSVRIHSLKGTVDINAINGTKMTEMFPKLVKELKTITNGDYIAEGILQFDLKDKSTGVLFKDYSHETAYHLGLLSEKGTEINGKVTVSLEHSFDGVYLESAPGSYTLSEENLAAVKNKGFGTEDVVNHLPDRFARSFLRGVFDGSDPVFSETIDFKIKSEASAKLMERMASKYLNTKILSQKKDGYLFHIPTKEAKEFMQFLYTAGPSLDAYNSKAAQVAGVPLCAHPDEDSAVIWIHDLLFHEAW